MNPEVSDFPGIYDALRIPKTTSVDVILVHGMCTHKEDWVTNTNKELAEALNMKLDNIGPPIPLGDSSTPDQSSHEAQLYTARMTGFGLTVNTFSIVWSPISDDAKRALCYDVSGGNASCPSAGEVTTGKRVLANRFLKETLLDNCLADAVFYAGDVGKEMIQSAIRRGVSWVLFGDQNDLCGEHAAVEIAPGNKGQTPLIFLTESLGSKMLYDTLRNTANSCASDKRHGFAAALQRPIEVFMAANQMPILSLADRTSSAQGVLGTAPGAAEQTQVPKDVTPAVNPVIDILKLSTSGGVPTSTLRQQQGAANNEAGVLAPKWVVAFSDPNDLFSYTLRSSGCQDGQTCGTVDNIHFSDVLVSNDWSYLFLFENPYSAHTEYLARTTASGIGQAVAKMIACGGRNYKQSCDPSADRASTTEHP
jgi:hypothetical protein